MDTRFADAGAALTDFTTHFLVHCPRCAGRALVRAGDQRLLCSSCHHSEPPGRWYGAWRLSAARRCPACGHYGSRQVESAQHRAKLSLRCAGCGDEREYAAKATHLPTCDGRMTDSVYGLPLWLQADFRGELFWAFNPEHLAYLRAYVSARLRERGILPRNTIRKNTSLVSRLPAFLKKAGHRPALLRLFDALEKR